MADQLDFHKVSESQSVEVYQAMQLLKTEQMTTDDGAALPAPRKYAPVQFDTVNPEDLVGALRMFDGYQIKSATISCETGITVVVYRADGEDYAPPEPGVERLQAKTETQPEATPGEEDQ